MYIKGTKAFKISLRFVVYLCEENRKNAYVTCYYIFKNIIYIFKEEIINEY